MKNQKFRVLSLAACAILLFAGCSDSDVATGESGSFTDEAIGNSDIENIKNSVMTQYSDTVTVGKVLDNWEGCNNPTWEAETTQRGEKLVKFTCDVVKETELPISCRFQHVGDCEADKNAMQHLVEQKKGIVFALSADNTSFTPVSRIEISTFDDGKKYISENSVGDLIHAQFLQEAYDNKPIYGSVCAEEYEKRQ